jgi:uncharacterized protein (DUF983 family)
MGRDADPNFLRRAVLRGFLHRCPNCGKGHLFRSYLKQIDRCEACGESFAEIRADDGPAWLTTLVIGHIVVALALISESSWPMPLWISITVFVSLGIAATLAFLPRAKGIFISAIWAMKATGVAAEPVDVSKAVL